MHSGVPSCGEDQGPMRKRAEGRTGMEKDGVGQEIQGGFLYKHGAV